MAKPVAGDIFYNKTTDRPRVALRVGERDLLTTDDSTGGSPTGAAGGDLGGTYPNPTVEALGTTGTAVTVGGAAPPTTGQVLTATSATAAAWATPAGSSPTGAAGGDLGGTYPNPTVEALGTTGTAVDVGSAAPGTVGQVLTLTDATHATWQDSIAVSALEGEYFYLPSSPDSRNDEFRSVTLDANWAWWKDPTGAAALAPNTADNGVTLTVDSSPATKPRYKIHTDRRRSWLQLQVPDSATSNDTITNTGAHYLLKPLTAAASECYWTRTLVSTAWITGGTGNPSSASHFLTLMAAAASTVTITNASPAVITWTNHGLAVGQTVVFSTTGALPTGLVAGTTYFVISAGLGANVFEVSLTAGGAAINTSSAGSGTHTATSNCPDRANQLLIGWFGNSSGNAGNAYSIMLVVAAGAQSTRPLGAFLATLGAIPSMGIRRRSSSNWMGFFFGQTESGFYREVSEFSLTFTPAFIGWRFHTGTSDPLHPIYGMDFLRFSTDVDALPF